MTLSFQNPTRRTPFDHFLDPQSMPRLFAFIDPVSAVYDGGQAGYAHTKMIT